MLLLLFLLPFVKGLVHDGITISITPAPTEADTAIAHKGTDIKPLTHQEQDTFQLTKYNLKKGVETLANQKPTNVFTQATLGNHIYKINQWNEVKREFKARSIRIVNITTTDEKQSETVYANHGNKKENVQAYVYEGHIGFNSSHRWSGNTKLTATVRYELIRPAKESLDYNYGSAVGDEEFSSGVNIVSIGGVAAKFDLNWGQAAKFIISANKVTTDIKVEYETGLEGDVVARFADKHEGKEFVVYDVNEVLKAVNLSTVVETIEFVRISYVKEYTVKVIDLVTNKDIRYTDLVTPDY